MIETVWHDDGHIIRLELNKSEVSVSETICPQTGECTHEDARCVVDYFLDRYGLEVNVGSCAVTQDIRVAWTLIEQSRDLEECQVWIIPADDPMFSAWVEFQRS